MQKQNSKKKFLEKLYIGLSFYFGDDDCDSVIKDYEEWFENEEMAGKSEHEICSGLGKPFDIARNLYKDSKEGKEHTFPLKSSILLQTIATLVIYYVLCVSLLRYFDKNGWNFYPVALIANILVFVAGLFILKKSKLTCGMQFKNHLLLIGLFFFILLIEVFLVMKKNEAGLGSYYVEYQILNIEYDKEIYNKQGIGFYNDISYTWYYYLLNVFYKSVTYVLYRKNAWA